MPREPKIDYALKNEIWLPQTKYLVGIDPSIADAKNNGLAIYDIAQKKYRLIASYHYIDVLDFIFQIEGTFCGLPIESIIFIVEANHRNKQLYTGTRSATNIGMQQGACKTIIKSLLHRKCFVMEYVPSRKGGTGYWDNEKAFIADTGYTESTSIHARDAARFIYESVQYNKTMHRIVTAVLPATL